MLLNVINTTLIKHDILLLKKKKKKKKKKQRETLNRQYLNHLTSSMP